MLVIPVLLLAVTVPTFSPKDRSTEEPFAVRIKRLIADLDDDRIKVREAATEELKRIGAAGEPALRRAWADSSSAETRRRIQDILGAVVDRFEGHSDKWAWVYGSLAHGQAFLAKGRDIQSLHLRVAWLNNLRPATPLHVEIRDATLELVHARGSIAPQLADGTFAWHEVHWRYRAPLAPGKSYVLMFHSQGSSNRAPWGVNQTFTDIYPHGGSHRDTQTYPGDFFFRLSFTDGKLIHVGPDLKAERVVPFNRGKAIGTEMTGSLGLAGFFGSPLPPGEQIEEAFPPGGLWTAIRGPVECRGHEKSVEGLAISPDGSRVVTGGSDQTLRLWQVANGKQVWKAQAIDPPDTWGGVSSVEFSPNGKQVAAIVIERSSGPVLRFWDAATGNELKSLLPAMHRSFGLAFSPDGTKLATAGPGVQVWDLSLSRKLHDFQFDKSIGRGWRVVFSPDGTRLAAALHDSGGSEFPKSPKVRVWEVNSGKEVFTAWVEGHANAVAFSPDGKLLAAGGERFGTVEIWDLTTRTLVHALRADVLGVFCLAFSPDGKTLVSGGSTPAIKLWDVRTGKSAGRLEGHTGQVANLGFSRDGKTLASAGRDNLVLLWRFAPD
jgi:WD40 repeat protein